MIYSRGRERALTDITAIQELATSTRPGKIVLPKVIHLKTLEAIGLTGQDARERKIGFRFRRGSWHAGPTRTGTAVIVQKDGSEINASTGTNLLIGRPHIHMHTHPAPDFESSLESVERRPRTQSWSPSKKKALAEREHRVHRGDYMLPSGGDIDNIYSISLGSVGNMVASTGGVFVSLRDDVRDKELLIHEDPQAVGDSIENYRELRQVSMKNGYSAPVTQKLILGAASQLLAHRYTCYFSPDPENPNLARVK